MESIAAWLFALFTVYNFYSRAKWKETWEKIMQFLVKETRMRAGKDGDLSYALIDSQSVRTAYRSDKRGYDGGKKERNKVVFKIYILPFPKNN